MTSAEADILRAGTPARPSPWPLRLEEARALLRLALPIALIALVNMGMSVTDTVMVSRLFGTGALAAVAVGSDLYSIVFYLSAGVLAGLSPFYTAAVTRADGAERRRLERIGWASVALLAVLTVPGVWFAPLWLAPLGLERGLLDLGRGYTQAMALTLVPMLGVVLYRTILTAAEKPKVFLKVTLAMLSLNALANYGFMVGAGPLPAFGPAGAGVSSLLVAAASLAVLVVVARRSAGAAALPPKARTSFDWHGLAAVLRVGLPIGIATVTELGIYLGATLYAARLGAADVAAHTLTLRTAGIAYAVPAALLQAAMVRTARAESLGDAHGGRAVAVSGLGLSVIFGALICLTLIAVSAPLSAWFFEDSTTGIAAAETAVGLLVLLGVLEFIIGPGQAAAGILRGRKDTRAPMTFVLVGYWAVAAPVALYLCEAEGRGATGIWIALAAGTLVTSTLCLLRLLAVRRQRS